MFPIQVFTGTLKPDYPSKWPPKLTFHTATCLLNPDVIDKCLVPGRPPLTQKVFIAWGKDGDQAISKSMWLLEIDVNDYNSLKWKKVFFLMDNYIKHVNMGFKFCVFISLINLITFSRVVLINWRL